MQDQKLTFSETIYLFADKFVTQRARFVNLENHPGGEKFPVKILGELMVIAAINFLEKKGYIRTNIKDVKKLLIFNSKDVFAERTREVSQEITGIEEILLQNISENTKLQTAVYYLLTSDDVLPWGDIINISKQSLVKKGFVRAEQEKKFIGYVTKYFLVPDKLGEVEAYVNDVKASLNDYSRDVKYSFITKAVGKGISARVEQQGADD